MDANDAARTLEEELARGRALIAAARSLEELDGAKIALLGRKAPISAVQSSIGSLPGDARRELGRRTNEAFAELRSALEARRSELEEGAEDESLRADAEIFTRMGYRVAEGPEIEDEWHNFEALNIPPDHPARTMKDSLYVDVPGLLLRTETSAVQIRTMESQDPPVYVVVPGRVYRREAVDATHLSVFHQLECLAVDEGLSLADLKGTLEAFAHEMFGPQIQARITPDYFPFVEPGAQMAVSCFVCNGVGCRVCGNGWLEQGGAGMVHPTVLQNCGYDAERYTGFAFGLGIERVAMVRYGVNDMRLLVEGDVRFLEQFEGVA
jgi:phenylalanyl-tRNA synthetase alpha chain